MKLGLTGCVLLFSILASCGSDDSGVDSALRDAGVTDTGDLGDTGAARPVFEVGDTLRGDIASEADLDSYATSLPSGMVLELELVNAEEDVAVSMTVRSSLYYRSAECVGCTRAAQFFIPQEGAYTVMIGGREGTRYEILTRLVPPAPIGPLSTASCEPTHDSIMGPPPGTREFPCPPGTTAGTIEDVEIAIYTLIPPTDLALVVQGLERTDVFDLTDGQLLDPLGELGQGGDPFRKGLHGGHEHLFVIEPYGTAVTPRPYHYEVGAWLTHADYTAPRALRVDSPAPGEISAVDGDAFDSDYFVVTRSGTVYFDVTPSSTVRLEVTAMTDDLQPTISLQGLRALPEGRTSAMEILANGHIRLDDLRNVPMSGAPADVGGPTFGYTALATAAEIRPTSPELPSSVSSFIERGSHDWYEFAQPPRSIVRVSADANAGREPVIQIGRSMPRFVSIPASFQNADSSPLSQLLGLRDVGFRSMMVDVTFLLFELDAPATPTIAEVEPNDTWAEAQPVTPDVTITGATEGVSMADPSADVFVVSLSAGETLGVHLESTRSMTDFDGEFPLPTIHLRVASGTIIDEGGSPRFFEAATDTDLYVEIVPACLGSSCTNVDYVAHLLTR
ncbi:MAG: hypothetical protein JRH11_15130 [Deltaproteobacteria bacterium]|nr:hypothetical protein [Deltaproteobacteria bacterium]